MIVRVVVLFLVLVGGIAAGSLVPSLSQAVRKTASFLPGPWSADPLATEGATARAAPPRTSERASEHAAGTAGGGVDQVRLTPEQIALARIELAQAKQAELRRHITVPGTIAPAADRIARVPAKVVGIVAEVRKRLGETVSKGEVVAVLESREIADARGDYLTASVNLDLQKTAFERAKILWEKRISAEQEFLRAKATFAEAELRLDLVRQKLLALDLDPNEVADTVKRASGAASTLRQYPIRSPASGRVVERKVDTGASVGQQSDPSELYTLVDLKVVWAELAVSTADLPLVKEGQRVVVMSGKTAAHAQRTEGKIVFVSPLLDKETRSARVIAEIPNPDETWRPGLFVTAEIALAEERAPVTVPRLAVQTIGGEPVVFVRTPDGFHKRAVTLGRSDHESVEITAGLEPGESVATANSFALKAELGRAQLEE